MGFIADEIISDCEALIPELIAKGEVGPVARTETSPVVTLAEAFLGNATIQRLAAQEANYASCLGGSRYESSTTQDKIDMITQHVMTLRGAGASTVPLAQNQHQQHAVNLIGGLVGSGSYITATSPASSPTWEIVHDRVTRTDRLRVEGGWLYRTQAGSSLALTFAPDPR